MKIYVASSWRNPYQPKVVEKLKEIGHEVYDFRNPKKGDNGFHWSEIDPLWESWTPEEYFKALSHPIAEKGFKLDFDAMKWADCCVMVLPCGRSANTEAGWMKGVGKEVYVYMPIQQEPELMYKIYDKVLTNFWELEYIGRECHGKIPEDCTAFGNIEGKACNHCSKFGLSHYASQRSDVSDEMTVYAVLFNPCTYESCAGVVSLHYTRKEAEMALEYSKNERIKEYERELDDDEVYFIQEFPIKAMQSGKIKPLATEKDKEEEIEREALILAKKHAKFSVGDFAVGFNWGAKYIKNKTV